MKNNFGSIYWVLFAFFIFGRAIPFVLPMALMGLMFFVVRKIINSFQQNNQNRVGTTAWAKTVSNRDKMRIDDKLRSYFRNNYSLPVYGDIFLTTKNGSYTTVEELTLTFGEEKILSMEEFRSYYPDVYNQIVDLLVAFSKADEQVFTAEVKTPEVKKEDILSDAQKYIDKINSLNTDIPNEEITKGLYQTCAYLKKIDVAEKKKNEMKLSKLYDYYLPILTNILENYNSLKKVDDSSKEFKDAEVQLIKTIILINEALKTINEQLHEEDYMNLSADITTLQSLLKKDGLVNNNPFEGGE